MFTANIWRRKNANCMNFTPENFGVEDHRVHQLELKFKEVRSTEEASCSGELNPNLLPM
jgi:hypothetical protein